MEATKTMDEFDCPRVPLGPFNYGRAHWRDNKTCSGCGSLSELEFFAAIERGEKIGPTDKNYKVYVGDRSKFYFQHLSEDGKHRFIPLLNAGSIAIGIPGHFYALPFFIRRKRDSEE